MSTFRERYNKENRWHQKAIIVELFHFTMKARQKGWNVRKTASYFSISLGSVSEHLNLAHAIHEDDSLIECPNKITAMHKLGMKMSNT